MSRIKKEGDRGSIRVDPTVARHALEGPLNGPEEVIEGPKEIAGAIKNRIGQEAGMRFLRNLAKEESN